MVWLGRPVITSEIGNWSVFVLFGWRFVFGIIVKWDRREIPRTVRCYRESGNNKAVSLLRLGSRKWAAPRTSLIGRPARGHSMSPPSRLTIVHWLELPGQLIIYASFMKNADSDSLSRWPITYGGKEEQEAPPPSAYIISLWTMMMVWKGVLFFILP